jgi:AmmeMemoRadiSam system protein B
VQYTRQPAVAGAFYPGNKEILASDVNALLKLAQMEVSDNRKRGDQLPPKALIVPHAGYIYSGPTAAAAYARLASVSDRIKRVILLGPVHRVPIRGLALPGADVFATPLGQIQIDSDAVAAIKSLPQVIESTAAHEQEHSLEVQLPFLQMALTDFTLLPLAVGDARKH